jgi:hypothetical protein
VLISVGILARSRLALFGVLGSLAALLPVALISPRQGFVWYIPLSFLALYWAAIFNKCFGRIPILRWALPPAISLLLLAPASLNDRQEGLLSAQSKTWSVLQQMKENGIHLARGSSILVQNDPFGEFWDMYFILHLYFNDPSLRVALTSESNPVARGDVQPSYDAVFRFEDGLLVYERVLFRPDGS